MTDDNIMQVELAEAKTAVEKQMLLQKYGMVEPKLTNEEKVMLKIEEINGTTEIYF